MIGIITFRSLAQLVINTAVQELTREGTRHAVKVTSHQFRELRKKFQSREA